MFFVEFIEPGGHVHDRGPQAESGEAGGPALGRGGHQATLKEQSLERKVASLKSLTLGRSDKQVGWDWAKSSTKSNLMEPNPDCSDLDHAFQACSVPGTFDPDPALMFSYIESEDTQK